MLDAGKGKTPAGCGMHRRGVMVRDEMRMWVRGAHPRLSLGLRAGKYCRHIVWVRVLCGCEVRRPKPVFLA
eukprot:9469929-Pyramimonas_sp.AAC.2